jgi:hypothetical protein
MTAVYGRIHTALDGWRLPVGRLRHLTGLIHVDTVTGTVVRAPYVRPIRDTADSPIKYMHQTTRCSCPSRCGAAVQLLHKSIYDKRVRFEI